MSTFAAAFTMHDSDFTLTSPLSDPGVSERPLLALTIVWHPDSARIGEQYVGDAGMLELNRYAPQFSRPGHEGLPLGHGGISREPLRFTRNRDDEVTIALPASRMTVDLNGRAVEGSVRLDADAVAAGQILTLGRAVVLCLHWMNCLPKDNPVPGLAGVGSAAIALRDQIRMVAPTDLTVLLLGETGTGKEIAARGIHALGRRSADRLVAVNMAALNEALAAADLFGAAKGAYTGAQAERRGLFAEADGATLFMDEIGNAPPSVQPMLLRVLEGGDYRPLGAAQDRRSTARLIAATDQDLDSASFNHALLRRLEGFTIQLPPLRARREDIGVLIVHLLGKQGALPPLPARLVTEIACYDWPGNIRQLGHTLKRIALLVENGGTPQLEQLVRMAPVPPSSVARLVAEAAPASSALSAGPRRKPSQLTEQDVTDAMVASDWNIQAASRMLGISRPSLYKLLDTHGEIRWAEKIPAEEIARAMAAHGDDVTRAAAALRTPTESLRREVRRLVV
ncbi:sigma 54-interacting transcriptional regulator [Massilia sp. YIM B02763]|uniref:sigma-54-dependent transcriptional regulator n=1 Tax=Massilia sp. YIM B02763 TaxID=3050130 RepID=UPI0025B687D2|nr:sigma 54-interacting transcriptional regulator [Massilia sp. YIM B02763]MDN4054873.1 sigma 54-interacting transcriptional regulator [Massilia sp. YIM B02763]